ncbi:MAG: hypothetical protein QNJ81_14125 [Acidimicrobiia bacterium]|nr:hypothetical protein [Acidimicrobiia bacterium]
MSKSDRSETDRLIGELVGAFPGYVRGKLAGLGVPIDSDVAGAVAAAAATLEAALHELLQQSAEHQARSPLELIRDATQQVTSALAAIGVRPRERDEWQQSQHPDDPYDLYPASSRDLGEEAWRLHLQWGIDKARSVAGVVPDTTDGEKPPRLPAVALFGLPLEERQPIVDVVAERGYRALVWRNPAALADAVAEKPVLVIVDDRHPEAHSAIRTLVGQDVRCVAVVERVDDLVVPGLLALGAADVVELGQLAARLNRLLPRPV